MSEEKNINEPIRIFDNFDDSFEEEFQKKILNGEFSNSEEAIAYLKEDLKKDYPELCKLLYNKAELRNLTESATDDLKIIDSWEKQAKKVMNLIWKHKEAHLFHKPVNPLELGIEDYFDKIKHPMDFSTIKKKLNNSTYRNCQEFVNDMQLVFDNCYLYNGETSVVGKMCTNVKQEYEKLYSQFGIEKLV